MFSLQGLFAKENQQNVQVFGSKIEDERLILNDEHEVNLNDKTSGKITSELNAIPGVNINSSYSQPSYVNINGLKTNHTLTLINDLPVFDQSSPNAVTNFKNISLTDFNKLNIYKGSQGGSYGNGAVGGVINMQTNMYESNSNVFVNNSYGNHNTYSGNLKANYKGSSFYSYFASSFNKTKGYNLVNSGNEKDEQQGGSALINLAYDINESNNIEVFSYAKEQKNEYDDWDYITNQSIDCISCSSNAKFNFNYIKLNQNYNNYTGYLAVFNNINNNSYNSDFGVYEIKANTTSVKYSGKINYGNFATNIGFENNSTSQTEYDENMNYYTLFAGQSVSSLNTLTSFNLSYTNSNYSVKDFVAYNFKSVYFINSNKTSSLFVNAGKSFRMPSINELFSPFGGNKELESEVIKSINVGFEAPLISTLSLQTSLFYNDVQNQITYAQGKYQNMPSAYTSKGLGSRLQIIKNSFLSSFVSYTFTDAKDKSNESNRVNYIPKHDINLFTSFYYKNLTTDIAFYYNTENYDTFNKVELKPYFSSYLNVVYKNPNSMFSYYLELNNALNNTQEVFYGYNNIGREINAGITAKF